MQPERSKTLGGYQVTSISEIERFEKAVKPLIDFMKENYHPHTTVIVTCGGAEVLEGLIIHNAQQ